KSPSEDEKRASSPNSIDTRAAWGRGKAIRARPNRLSSRPLPTDTDNTATPSTREKLVKLMPAANQKLPGSGGKYSASVRSSCSGSDETLAAGSSALMNGYSPNLDRSSGTR